MSNSKQALHPFFQPRKPQNAISAPALDDSKGERKNPIPAKKMVVKPFPPPATREFKQQQQTNSSISGYVKKGECSTPYYAPIAKPKFYSDTVEYQQQVSNEESFNSYGKSSLQKKKQKNDHEFSRMNRHIFGHGHVTDKKFDTTAPYKYPDFTRIDLQQYIKDNQGCFFQQHKLSREANNVKKSKHNNNQYDVQMTSKPSSQNEVEALLNTCFPGWQVFSSCVVLMQSIFDKKQRTNNINKQWVDKYRPQHLNGLLGERHNHRYIKDWLHQMKIEPLSAPTGANDKPKKGRKKKHKKLVLQRDVDFDDEDVFLRNLTLYEDDNDDDFMMKPGGNKKVLKKESMRSNIILLVGDHGIGKTASVYTIAEQMDYEVFEINAGSRRSGKDIMSAVGEMTKSHLVAFGIAPPASASSLFLEKSNNNNNNKTIKTGKKKRLNPTLRSSSFSAATTTASTSKPALKDFLAKKRLSHTVQLLPPATPSTTKQSLILLEEVDILFEEDKGFWPSVVELSQNSKRPIIMTCNDPDQVPIESMSLQAIIDMKPPNESELLAYLWLMCFAEGYTVDPADLVCLVAFLGRDIRQLIQTLELYAGQGIFGHYLGITNDMSTLETKFKSAPSKLAIDTFRLARSYQRLEGYVKKEELNELDDIERILENNAFIDACLGWKENGAMIQESIQDQLNGYTTLWVEDDEDCLDKHINKEIEYSTTVLNNSSVDWIMDEESHWDELCDARSINYKNCSDTIEGLLPPRQRYQPNEYTAMMEYVPYIQQMITEEGSSMTRTRSKRKRLHLPLNKDSVETLSNHQAPIDETQVHIQLLFELKKS